MDLKANDYYQIEAGFTLDQDMLESIVLLYQPLIGQEALSFYLTCLYEAKKQDRYQNHGRLTSLIGINIDPLEKARIKCEQFQLVRTYKKTNHDKTLYIYKMQKPLSASDFLNHDLFGRLYTKYVGMKQAEMTKNKLITAEIDKTSFEEISASFENSIINSWNEENEMEFAKLREVSLKEKQYSGNFDVKLFLSEISTLVFPKEARTPANIELIASLADLYGVSLDDMIIFVGQSMNLVTKTLVEDKLRSLVRNSKKAPAIPKSENPYEMPPALFLQNKQDGIALTLNDKKILETLSHDLQMKPEVINVLLEYVLELSDGKLVRGFVESIAASWVRLHVNSLSEALKTVEIQRKQTRKKKAVKEMTLPKYYQKQAQQQEEQQDPIDEIQLSDLEERLKKRG